MTIYFEEDGVVTQEILTTMEKAAAICLEGEGITGELADLAELSVSFVGKDEIRALNAEHRGIDRVTDVLSFPQFDDLADLPEDLEYSLGDVVICREVAEEQGEEFGHGYEREIIYLFTHSVLHLLGYDHEAEEDKKEMRAREEEVMSELGLTR